jgi:ABC transport system ATP-binding/permease protein
VCGYLKDFLFDPKMARQPVSTLSGGQQNRLLLAKVLAMPGSVLILDEPTNDLDMDTLDMLQEILADYPGTLIIVSHDRDFLDKTVTTVLAFEGNGVVEAHVGGYSDYLATKKQKKSTPPSTIASPIVDKTKEKQQVKKVSYKTLHEFENLPIKIKALEEEREALHEVLHTPNLYTQDPVLFDKTTRRLSVIDNELAMLEARWVELEKAM